MGKFKNRIWTRDEYLINYATLNKPEAISIYYPDTVLFVKCDGEIVTQAQMHDLKKDGDNTHIWNYYNIPIHNNFKFVKTKETVIMCEPKMAKYYLKNGVKDCTNITLGDTVQQLKNGKPDYEAMPVYSF